MITQTNGIYHCECDICGTAYPLIFKKFSKYFSDIPLSDSIRIELVEGTQTAISTFRVCPACAGKVYGHIIQLRKEAGVTSLI